MWLRRSSARVCCAALILTAALPLTALTDPAQAAKSTKKIYCTGVQGRTGVNAKQVIEIHVTGKSSARMYRCTKDANGRYYHYATGKKAVIGLHGAVAASKKREGDGKTPLGVFTMRDGFGTDKKSGLRGRSYTRVTKKKQWVWVDGRSKSAKNKRAYNTMRRHSQGYRGEDLRDTYAYVHAQAIGYNEARKVGRGSAIFLHRIPKSGKTLGCVALKKADLVATLKWEKSSTVQIVIH